MTKMIPLSLGIGALGNAARHVVASQTPHATSTTGASFATLVSNSVVSTTRSIAAAESVSASALEGKASTREVVEKLMEAEQNLQIAIAVRDKTVAAIQEITRMSI